MKAVALASAEEGDEDGNYADSRRECPAAGNDVAKRGGDLGNEAGVENDGEVCGRKLCNGVN